MGKDGSRVPRIGACLALRKSLDYLHAGDWRPLNVGLLLHLHRLLFTETPGHGGALKSSDNIVVDASPDGTRTIRFEPVTAVRTERVTVELIERYDDAVRDGTFHPVLLVGLFVLDLLTVHPFDDGNGRIARVLTKALPMSGQRRVREHVLDRAPEFFKIADIRTALPGISDQTIRLARKTLKAEGRTRCEGTGRGAQWRRLGI